MSHSYRASEGLVAPAHEAEPAWIVVPREGRETPARRAPWPERQGESAPPAERRLRQVSREVECLRAAYVSAGRLRRWWFHRRLRVLEAEKAALEQHWRRRKQRGAAKLPFGG
jgi:hypothetical protein